MPRKQIGRVVARERKKAAGAGEERNEKAKEEKQEGVN